MHTDVCTIGLHGTALPFTFFNSGQKACNAASVGCKSQPLLFQLQASDASIQCCLLELGQQWLGLAVSRGAVVPAHKLVAAQKQPIPVAAFVSADRSLNLSNDLPEHADNMCCKVQTIMFQLVAAQPHLWHLQVHNILSCGRQLSKMVSASCQAVLTTHVS